MCLVEVFGVGMGKLFGSGNDTSLNDEFKNGKRVIPENASWH
jgi:hypothetical protein